MSCTSRRLPACAPGSTGRQVPVILERSDLIVEGAQLGAPRRGKQLLKVRAQVLPDEGTALECQCGFIPVRRQNRRFRAVPISVAAHRLAWLELPRNSP